MNLYVVCNEYRNGHKYWHGFRTLPDAESFRKTFDVFESIEASGVFHITVTLNEKQSREAAYPNGCVLYDDQLPKYMPEVRCV